MLLLSLSLSGCFCLLLFFLKIFQEVIGLGTGFIVLKLVFFNNLYSIFVVEVLAYDKCGLSLGVAFEKVDLQVCNKVLKDFQMFIICGKAGSSVDDVVARQFILNMPVSACC